jgi:hypothetical protein
LIKEFGSLENYYSKFHTKLQNKVFMLKYGGLLRDLNTYRLKKRTVLVPLADLLQQLSILLAVFSLKIVPSFSVFLIMYTTLLLIGFFINL